MRLNKALVPGNAEILSWRPIVSGPNLLTAWSKKESRIQGRILEYFSNESSSKCMAGGLRLPFIFSCGFMEDISGSQC